MLWRVYIEFNAGFIANFRCKCGRFFGNQVTVSGDPRAVDEKARFLHVGEHRGKRHFGIRRAQLFLKNGFQAEGKLGVAAGRVVTEILRSE